MRAPLTAAQLRHYRSEGFVRLGRILDRHTVEGLRKEESRLRKSRLPQDPGGAKDAIVFRSQLCNYSAPVRNLVLSDALVAPARQLVGSNNLALWFHQYVTKMPDRGREATEFPWHQDHAFTALEPATDTVIWIALDDCDENNGCVWIKPRTHRQGLRAHHRNGKQPWNLTTDVEGDGVAALLKAGEAVAFTGRTLHRSKYNRTARPRRGFFANYCDAGAMMGEEQRPVISFLDRWVVSGHAPVPKL